MDHDECLFWTPEMTLGQPGRKLYCHWEQLGQRWELPLGVRTASASPS